MDPTSYMLTEAFLDCEELRKEATEVIFLKTCRKLSMVLKGVKNSNGVMWCIMISQNKEVLKHVSLSNTQTLKETTSTNLCKLACAAVFDLTFNSDDKMQHIDTFCEAWELTKKSLWHHQRKTFETRCLFLAMKARFQKDGQGKFQDTDLDFSVNLDRYSELGMHLGMTDTTWIQKLKDTPHLLHPELANALLTRSMLVDQNGMFPAPYRNKKMHSIKDLDCFSEALGSQPLEERTPTIEECLEWNEKITSLHTQCNAQCMGELECVKFLKRWNALCVANKWIKCPIVDMEPTQAFKIVAEELINSIEGKFVTAWWMHNAPYINMMKESRLRDEALISEIRFKECCGELGMCDTPMTDDVTLVRFQPCEKTMVREYYLAVVMDDVWKMHAYELEIPAAAISTIFAHAENIKIMARLQYSSWCNLDLQAHQNHGKAAVQLLVQS